MTTQPKDYTVCQHIESYAVIYLDYNGFEVDSPKPMTLKQANYLAKQWGGFVSSLKSL